MKDLIDHHPICGRKMTGETFSKQESIGELLLDNGCIMGIYGRIIPGKCQRFDMLPKFRRNGPQNTMKEVIAFNKKDF